MYYASSYELNQYKHIKYILNEKFTSNSLHEKHRMVVYLHRINIKIIFKLLNRLTIIFKQRNVRYIKEYRQYLLNKLTKYALIIAILFSLFIYGNFFINKVFSYPVRPGEHQQDSTARQSFHCLESDPDLKEFHACLDSVGRG